MTAAVVLAALALTCPHSLTVQGPNGPVTGAERPMVVCVYRQAQSPLWRSVSWLLATDPDLFFRVAWPRIKMESRDYRWAGRCRPCAPGERVVLDSLPAGTYHARVYDDLWNESAPSARVTVHP